MRHCLVLIKENTLSCNGACICVTVCVCDAKLTNTKLIQEDGIVVHRFDMWMPHIERKKPVGLG